MTPRHSLSLIALSLAVGVGAGVCVGSASGLTAAVVSSVTLCDVLCGFSASGADIFPRRL